MKVYDFSYDGILLSDLGLAIVEFNGADGFNTMTNGSELNWNTVSFRRGERWLLTHHNYEQALTATIKIGMNPCSDEIGYLDDTLVRTVSRWLNRGSFHKLVLMGDDARKLYFNASMNVSKVMLGDEVIGLELAVTTDAPFALSDLEVHKYESTTHNWQANVPNISDKEGFTYPKVTVELKEAGTLKIVGIAENRITEVRNCAAGETITFDSPIISASVKDHEIEDDFIGWEFPRLIRDFRGGGNNFMITLPCKMTFEYVPAVKLAFN